MYRSRGAQPPAASKGARRAWSRWLHLDLGGALLMPFFLVTLVIAGLIDPEPGGGSRTAVEFAAYVAALPLAALAALLPGVRALEETSARSLLGFPYALTPPADPHAPGARGRLSLWLVVHLGLGGLIAGASLAVPPFCVVLLVVPFAEHSRLASLPWVDAIPAGWAPPIGLALLAVLVVVCVAAGELIARAALRLLGPSPAELLAAERARVRRLARRNRLASDLHDAVGHSLSVVALQAGAAARVLDSDPGFARGALAAIEACARDALDELDRALGLLRADEQAPPPDDAGQDEAGKDDANTDDADTAAPDLGSLDRLVERTRSTGADVSLSVTGAGPVPDAVSRAAYRIVQEGLGNALRHAGPGPVEVCVTLGEREVGLSVVSPLPPASVRARPSRRGGRGLVGIRERVAGLGGSCTAGPEGECWRLAAQLPLEVSR
ncbi:MAG TPA: histidine kinase [Actinocrinis sp.]